MAELPYVMVNDVAPDMLADSTPYREMVEWQAEQVADRDNRDLVPGTLEETHRVPMAWVGGDAEEGCGHWSEIGYRLCLATTPVEIYRVRHTFKAVDR